MFTLQPHCSVYFFLHSHELNIDRLMVVSALLLMNLQLLWTEIKLLINLIVETRSYHSLKKVS